MHKRDKKNDPKSAFLGLSSLLNRQTAPMIEYSG